MTDNPIIQNIRNLIYIRQKDGTNLEEIEADLKKFTAKAYHQIIDKEILEIKSDMEGVHSMIGQSSIVDPNTTQWYSPKTKNNENWKKYAEHLKNKKEPLPDSAIQSIDYWTNKIISRCSDPYSPNVNSKGLVVGYVQSGKTANFIGLLAKAADAGYNLIVVLSGTKEKLRKQTQERVEDDLCSLNPGKLVLRTSKKQDFITPTHHPEAWFTANQTSILIIKKQNNRLNKFIDWITYDKNKSTELNKVEISESTRSLARTLIIDDEADEASINVSRTADMSRIYEKIVTIRRTLPKSAFVGYTATPFANMLIDHTSFEGNNLYPSDFIINLPKPDGYFGAEEVFGRRRTESEINQSGSSENISGKDMVRIIESHELPDLKPARNNQIKDFKPKMSKSLKDAIHYYLLSTCIKIARIGKNEHTTMFVHTHVRASVQISTINLINTYINDIRKNFKKDNSQIINLLKNCWQKEIHKVKRKEDEKKIDFNEAILFLDYVIENIIITLVNTSRLARELPPLNYEKEENEPGKIYLVIGGNILSRGLTLKGLTVSYFLRTSSMYDTLLQMGRWFGFRNGYSDLPRIWTTTGLRDNFYHLAQVEQEIREEMFLYNNLGITPLSYKVRIRLIPSLQVTSRLKMQDAEVNKRYNLNTKRSEVTVFEPKNLKLLDHNINSVKKLFEKNSSKLISYKHQFILNDVSSTDIKTFLDVQDDNHFIINQRETTVNPGLINKYIDDLTESNLLTNWNIVFDSLSNPSDELGFIQIANNLKLNCRERSELLDKSDFISFKHITSEKDYYADIEDNVQKSIKDNTIVKKLNDFNEANDFRLNFHNPNKLNNKDKEIYRLLFARTNGMIFILPISKYSKSVESVQHIISFMIVFPPFTPRRDASVSTMAQPLLRSNYVSGIPDLLEDNEFGEHDEELEGEFEDDEDDDD
jgi:hypothetical protein